MCSNCDGKSCKCQSTKGWECPTCGNVYSPNVELCFKCSSTKESNESTKKDLLLEEI